MSSTRISIQIDDELLAELRDRVGGRHVSSYVNEALHRSLQHDRFGDLLAQLEDESGPVSYDIRREVDERWRRIVVEGSRAEQVGGLPT